MCCQIIFWTFLGSIELKTIVLHPGIMDVENFRETISSQTPDFGVEVFSDSVNPQAVEIVILWLDVMDCIGYFPNLKLILVCGSGIDRVIKMASLPKNIPLVRVIDLTLQDHVSDYVVMAVLNHTRSWNHYMNLQHRKHWEFDKYYRTKPMIGIMGLGAMGDAAAKKLLAMDFKVCGWVRGAHARTLSNVYQGRENLDKFAKQCEIIVCMLPLTPETKGILNNSLFNTLPKGAYLINIGRGSHLNEDDLIAALDSDQLSGACLDVFESEPLPDNHPFWTHPKITITPHIAGVLLAEEQAIQAAKLINQFYNLTLKDVVDYHAGY